MNSPETTHPAPLQASHATIASRETHDSPPDAGRATGQTPRVCLHCQAWRTVNYKAGFCGTHGDKITAAMQTCAEFAPA